MKMKHFTVIVSLMATQLVHADLSGTSGGQTFTTGEQIIVATYRGAQYDYRAEILSVDQYNNEATVKPLLGAYLPSEVPMVFFYKTEGCMAYQFGEVCVGDSVTDVGQEFKVAGIHKANHMIALSGNKSRTDNRSGIFGSTEKIVVGIYPEAVGFTRGCSLGFCVGDELSLESWNRSPGETLSAKVASVNQNGYVYFKFENGEMDLVHANTKWIKSVEFKKYSPEVSKEDAQRGQLPEKIRLK